jgi:ATP adenylyltransferase
MDILYAPWRTAYTLKAAQQKKEPSLDECIFCIKFADPDEAKHFIIRKFPHAVVVLNLYPYNAGHLLILPLKHITVPSQMEPALQTEIMKLIGYSSDIVMNTLTADGVNIGLNLGKVAGASVPGHLHFHVLPRWLGDTNFLPTLANTKQVSVDLREIYTKLVPAFASIK